MKKPFMRLTGIGFIYLIFLYPSNAFGESILIENQSFAVVTETPSMKNGQCQKAAMLIKNNNCLITYSVSYGDSTLGSGELNVFNSPQTITLGDSRLHISCQVQGNVKVTKK